MRRQRLTRSIGTKVTEDDYAELVTAAGADTLSDWLRDRLTEFLAGRRPPTQLEILLAEVLALRRILLNIVAWNVSGQTVTEDTLAALIVESDAKRMDLARARIEGLKWTTDDIKTLDCGSAPNQSVCSEPS